MQQPQMTEAAQMENDWISYNDARTLADAEAIKADPERYAKAMDRARELRDAENAKWALILGPVK